MAEAAGGFSSLTPSGTSVLLEGHLTETPAGTKQVLLLHHYRPSLAPHTRHHVVCLVYSMAICMLLRSMHTEGRLRPLWLQDASL